MDEPEAPRRLHPATPALGRRLLARRWAGGRRMGGRQLARLVAERRRSKLLPAATRLARGRSLGRRRATAVEAAPPLEVPGMSDWAARWIFGGEAVEGVPFESALLAREPSEEPELPSFLVAKREQEETAAVAEAARRAAPIQRGRVEEVPTGFKLARKPLQAPPAAPHRPASAEPGAEQPDLEEFAATVGEPTISREPAVAQEAVEADVPGLGPELEADEPASEGARDAVRSQAPSPSPSTDVPALPPAWVEPPARARAVLISSGERPKRASERPALRVARVPRAAAPVRAAEPVSTPAGALAAAGAPPGSPAVRGESLLSRIARAIRREPSEATAAIAPASAPGPSAPRAAEPVAPGPQRTLARRSAAGTSFAAPAPSSPADLREAPVAQPAPAQVGAGRPASAGHAETPAGPEVRAGVELPPAGESAGADESPVVLGPSAFEAAEAPGPVGRSEPEAAPLRRLARLASRVLQGEGQEEEAVPGPAAAEALTARSGEDASRETGAPSPVGKLPAGSAAVQLSPVAEAWARAPAAGRSEVAAPAGEGQAGPGPGSVAPRMSRLRRVGVIARRAVRPSSGPASSAEEPFEALEATTRETGSSAGRVDGGGQTGPGPSPVAPRMSPLRRVGVIARRAVRPSSGPASSAEGPFKALEATTRERQSSAGGVAPEISAAAATEVAESAAALSVGGVPVTAVARVAAVGSRTATGPVALQVEDTLNDRQALQIARTPSERPRVQFGGDARPAPAPRPAPPIRGSSGLRLARATGAAHDATRSGLSTVLFAPGYAGTEPPVSPGAVALPTIFRQDGAVEATSAPAEPAATPQAPAPGPGEQNIDEIYEKVVERLRRDLLIEREKMGDVLGDLM